MPSFGFGQTTITPQARRLAPRRQRGTFMPVPPQFQSGGLDRTAQGVTSFFYCLPIPAPYFAVRFLFGNIDAVNTFALSGIAFSASDSVNDYMTPTGATAWRYATYVNGGALENGTDTDLPRDPATTLAGATGFPVAVPVNSTYALTGATNIPNLIATDWNYATSLDPANAGPASFLFMRVFGPGQIWRGVVQSAMASGWTGVAAINQGFDMSVRLGIGDYVTNPAIALGTTGAATAHPLVAVQYLTLKGVINVMVAGDSTMAGATTTGGFNNATVQACLSLSKSLGIPVNPVNAAWGGSSTNTYWPVSNLIRSVTRPSIEIIPGWTSNETINTRILSDRCLGRMLSGVERARQNGAIPIIMTPTPRSDGSMTGATLTEWQYIRSRINAQAPGIAVVDAGALVGNPATGTYLAGNNTDNQHPNDVGHGVLAEAIKPLVRMMVGRISSGAA
ncbi:MAG: hypothetical protein CFE31_09935 [Rhizobiales bacterium PAR1]|nr:MAG: hypothetical protein CFE31_09935 [Rhizobiales bacterium PAR1]